MSNDPYGNLPRGYQGQHYDDDSYANQGRGGGAYSGSHRGGRGGGRGGYGYDDRRGGDSWRDVPPPRQQHWDEREDRDDRKRGRYDDYDAGYPPPRQSRDPQYDAPRYPPASSRAYDDSYLPYEGQQQPSYHQDQPSYHQDRPDHSTSGGGRDRHQSKPDTPSASVVLLGLPLHVNDVVLHNFLTDLGASVDSTTVIMDRTTGLSKRYGFAKFASVEHARAFVEPNWPVITWRERGMNGMGPDDGMKIKINYSQKSGGYREDQGASSRASDDQRKAAEANQAPQSMHHNDGTRDIGSAPTQILLLRGLDPLTSEEDIVTGLSTLQGRAGDEIRQGKGVKRILITKDRQSRSSWGYAFVQFADVRLATEVLGAAFNPHLYPTGFRIRSSVIAFSFCHENSFIPIYAKSEWSFRGEGGQELTYWDDKAFVTAWSPDKGKSKEKEVAKVAPVVDSSEADMEAFFSSLEAEAPPALPQAVAAAAPAQLAALPPPAQISAPSQQASTLPPPASTSTISINLKSTIAPGALPAVGPGSAAAALATASTPVQAEKKKVDLIQSKKMSANISKWNTKQQELKTPASDPPPIAPTVSSPAVAPTTSISISASPAEGKPKSLAIIDDLEFGDPTTMICLLCQRQFKTIDDLKKHNKLSALHKTNLMNETTVAEAKVRKAKKSASGPSTPTATDSPAPESKYIDRAAARREAFNQPEHPAPDARKRRDGPPPPPPPEVQLNRDGIEEDNVGAKMLEKMGWAKGGGLGSSGSGIVDPIQASQFQQGAGLGATKGVVVGSYDSTPQGNAERARVAARQRYENA